VSLCHPQFAQISFSPLRATLELDKSCLACLSYVFVHLLKFRLDQEFDAGLSQSIRKRINPPELAKWSSSSDVHDFVESTKAAHFQCIDSRGRISVIFSKVLCVVHKSAPVFDVFVQQQPFIASLVWGICRFLVQVRAHRLSGCKVLLPRA
jgi:hypothetical protein